MTKNKNLRMFIGGRFISLIGSGIQTIALPLYILDKTGSAALMGVFTMLTLMPAIAAAPFSGIIGDRRNRRNVMIAADAGRGLLICFLGVLAMKGSFSIYILFGVQVLISVMDSVFNASSAALMPDLVSQDELIEANSVRGGTDAASNILGPVLGGLIYGIWGIKMIFYVNGISFILSAIFSIFIAYSGKASEKGKMDVKMFFKENVEVIKFIGSKKGLLQLFTFAMISNFMLAPMFDVIIPYVLKKAIGFTSQQYGYIMGFFTVGLLLGNVGISIYFKKSGLKKLMKSGLIIETLVTAIFCVLVMPGAVRIYGGATWMLFISLSLCCTAMGCFNAFVNTPISTNLQNMVPAEMRSRFFSILGMFSQGAVPLGALLFGILLDMMKYYNLVIAINILSAITVIVFLTRACDEAYEAKQGTAEQGTVTE